MKGCTPEYFEHCISEGWELGFSIDDVEFFYERWGTKNGFHLSLTKGDIDLLDEDIIDMDGCLEKVLSIEIFENKQLKDCYDDIVVRWTVE